MTRDSFTTLDGNMTRNSFTTLDGFKGQIKPIVMSDKQKIEFFTNNKIAFLNYLQAKIKEQDWHAVSDLANDLRVADARLEELNARAAKKAKQ